MSPETLKAAAASCSSKQTPPPGARSIDQVLEEARSHLRRLSPQEAYAQLSASSHERPSMLVDIRPAAQRALHGQIPIGEVVERNVLEWRFDPRSDACLEVATTFGYALTVLVLCQEGYTSSLAARSLQHLGLLACTDVIGGFKAWKEAGLPVVSKEAAERGASSGDRSSDHVGLGGAVDVRAHP